MNLFSVLLLPLASLYGDIFSTASISETPEGGLLIQSAPARYAAWVLAFPVLLFITRWCWRRGIGGNFAPGFFFASFIIPLLIVPALALESVSITPQRLTIRTGFWFSPTVHEVLLSDVRRIVERDEPGRSRRIKVPETYWHFLDTSGKWRGIDLPDLLEANRLAAAEYLGRHGHPVKVSGQDP